MFPSLSFLLNFKSLHCHCSPTHRLRSLDCHSYRYFVPFIATEVTERVRRLSLHKCCTNFTLFLTMKTETTSGLLPPAHTGHACFPGAAAGPDPAAAHAGAVGRVGEWEMGWRWRRPKLRRACVGRNSGPALLKGQAAAAAAARGWGKCPLTQQGGHRRVLVGGVRRAGVGEADH